MRYHDMQSTVPVRNDGGREDKYGKKFMDSSDGYDSTADKC